MDGKGGGGKPRKVMNNEKAGGKSNIHTVTKPKGAGPASTRSRMQKGGTPVQEKSKNNSVGSGLVG